jgi:hypothetical protein
VEKNELARQFRGQPLDEGDLGSRPCRGGCRKRPAADRLKQLPERQHVPPVCGVLRHADRVDLHKLFELVDKGWFRCQVKFVRLVFPPRSSAFEHLALERALFSIPRDRMLRAIGNDVAIGRNIGVARIYDIVKVDAAGAASCGRGPRRST